MSLLNRWGSALRKCVPSRATLAQQPWLKPYAPWVLAAPLWRLQEESVARGVAIGTFWAFMIPIGQTFAAIGHCVWWRGNIPAAAMMTMLTNPLTFGFWLWLAYPVGRFFLGGGLPSESALDLHWSQQLQALGGPVLLGMAIFGVGGGGFGYLVVKGTWWFRRMLKRRKARSGDRLR